MTDRRVAFVTGGAGGIGAAICRSLAKAGQTVAIADLLEEPARTLAAELGGFAAPLDVTDPASVERAAAAAIDALGPIDVLVNCAGWDRFQPFLETDEAFQERVLAINLAGPMRVTRALLGPMVERRFGRVINIASGFNRMSGGAFNTLVNFSFV